MALTVLDSLKSLGQKDTAQHVIEACPDLEIAPNEESIRCKIGELKRKHNRLKKSSSRLTGKQALLDFYKEEFCFPRRDAMRPQRFSLHLYMIRKLLTHTHYTF